MFQYSIEIVFRKVKGMIFHHIKFQMYSNKHDTANTIKHLNLALFNLGFFFFLLFRFTPADPAWSDDDVITCWENTTLFLTSSYQYIILAFVLNKGYPHRKPFYRNCKIFIF